MAERLQRPVAEHLPIGRFIAQPDGIDGHNRALTVAVSGILDDITRREQEIVTLLNDVIRRYLTPV